ncbi:exosortase/archaeosortase family protein [Syntrophus buswellii]|uniref:exosortase/archaeosortase family protein n=1 Tax=Syntrophus buswellii TaxID=43774 RepID=UPI0038D4BC4F
MKIPKADIMRHGIFLVGVLSATAMAYWPLTALLGSRLARDYHSLIPFIPIISIYLLYLKRKELLKGIGYSFLIGPAILIAGLAFFTACTTFGGSLNLNDNATVITASSLLVIWGTFIFAYGTKAFTSALFPLLFLVFMIPFPYEVMEWLITFLQKGSTEFANFLLWLSQVPYYREGFVFHTIGIDVEVAPECSGIRSGLALLITALLAGYLFLNSWWRRAILALCVIPITMLKNGIRITTLTLLSTYVDPRILQSPLHREGGIPFFILALLLMAPILYFLRKREEKVNHRE